MSHLLRVSALHPDLLALKCAVFSLLFYALFYQLSYLAHYFIWGHFFTLYAAHHCIFLKPENIYPNELENPDGISMQRSAVFLFSAVRSIL